RTCGHRPRIVLFLLGEQTMVASTDVANAVRSRHLDCSGAEFGHRTVHLSIILGASHAEKCLASVETHSPQNRKFPSPRAAHHFLRGARAAFRCCSPFSFRSFTN